MHRRRKRLPEDFPYSIQIDGGRKRLSVKARKGDPPFNIGLVAAKHRHLSSIWLVAKSLHDSERRGYLQWQAVESDATQRGWRVPKETSAKTYWGRSYRRPRPTGASPRETFADAYFDLDFRPPPGKSRGFVLKCIFRAVYDTGLRVRLGGAKTRVSASTDEPLSEPTRAQAPSPKHSVTRVPAEEPSSHPSAGPTASEARSVFLAGLDPHHSHRQFVEALALGLDRAGIPIIAGSGEGVGKLAHDVIQQAHPREATELDRRIEIHRIPRDTGTRAQSRSAHALRTDLITRCRAIVVVAGDAGTSQEARIGLSMGRPVVPIPWTGGTAALDWVLAPSRMSANSHLKEFLADANLVRLMALPVQHQADQVASLVDRILS